ncbi:MAG: hypothetical protein ACJA0Z_004221 [Halioglobus sp.]|jgi:hypothetical protein
MLAITHCQNKSGMAPLNSSRENGGIKVYRLRSIAYRCADGERM